MNSNGTDWNMISALGQWTGSILTAIVIYLAIKKDSPRVKLECLFIADEAGGTIRVNAINKSYIPVSIVNVIIRDIHDYKQIISCTDHNDMLNPADKKIIAELRRQAFIDKGITEISKIITVISAVDHYGNEYHVDNRIRTKIKRFLRRI